MTLLGWLAIPILGEALRPILDEDARDPVRFRHSLRFSGDLEGDLRNARFALTIAGREGTCGPDGDAFSLSHVNGTVGGRELALWITIKPYHGPGVYRARHEFGRGVADPGQAELAVEDRQLQSWYAQSGTITVNADERSGSVDAVNGPVAAIQPYARNGPTRITGTWQCLPPASP